MIAAGLALLFALAAAYAWRLIPGPDIAWLLLCAGRWLDGASYGADILEVNPPLIVWLYSIAVLGARLTGLQPHHALVMELLLIIAGSLCTTAVILSRVTECWRVIIAALAAALLLLPGTEFAQREHFAAALTLPWVALAAARIVATPIPARWIAIGGAIGALGLILKPYFLIAWLAMEAAVISRRGLRSAVRTENLIAVALGVGYITATLAVMPDFLDLARRLGPLYRDYMTQGQDDALLAIGAALAIAILVVRRTDDNAPALGFGMAAVGFGVAGAIQMKWFPYHFLPAAVMLSGAAAAVAHELGAVVKRTAGRPALTAALLAGVVVWLHGAAVVRAISIARDPLDDRNLAETSLPEMRDFILRTAPGGTVVTLSTNIQSGFPAVPLSGARWGLRLPSLWPLFAVYRHEMFNERVITTRPAGDRTGPERWFTDMVYADLMRSRPDIIFILKYDPVLFSSGGARRFDYIAYFTAEPRFRAFFAQYRDAGEVGRYDALVRKSGLHQPAAELRK